MENQEWILADLSIRQDWNKKGLYVGNCRFSNGIKMEMSIALDATASAKMVSILNDQIVASARELGDRLIKSMPKQIEASTQDVDSPSN